MEPLTHGIMKTSVCIATRNRREELRQTLLALGQLIPAPDEILVCCDGCTDGTEAMLQQRWLDGPRNSLPRRVRLPDQTSVRRHRDSGYHAGAGRRRRGRLAP